MVALAVDLQHLLREERSENLVAIRVTLLRYSFDATVRQSKLRLHQAYN